MKNKKKEILRKINNPDDIKKLSEEELIQLADEVREFVIETVSQTGGHFGSNLGVVELTVAIHRVFDTPSDLIVWDVGHQTYPHKILTERKHKMSTIRQKGGLAPFTKRTESKYDAFDVGHSSTSISVATGMAEAIKESRQKRQVVAVIGDGALGGGMAFEALNHAGDINADILVVLNDNKMSISPNVGGLSDYLTRLISSPTYVKLRNKGRKALKKIPSIQEFARKVEIHTKGLVTPGTFFEELGFEYYGPVDGHDVKSLIKILDNLKKVRGPKFLHVITKKGKGYAPAEKDDYSLHAVKPFDPITGAQRSRGKKDKKITFTEVFSKWICDKAEEDKALRAITPAMCAGSGLTKFSKKFPRRYYDVGIAEQHAVTFAGGLACLGKKPVVAIYSSFLQRAYDQVIHDIALQNLDVLFAIDRAGVVGPDGATHSGSFDLSFLRIVPNMVIMTPADENSCYMMLEAGYDYKGPVAVRYPRGSEKGVLNQNDISDEEIEIGKAKRIFAGKRIAILSFGTMLGRCVEVAKKMDATLIDMRFVKPLDENLLHKLSENHEYFVTVEDNVILGGAGSAVNEFVLSNNLGVKVSNLGLPDKFLEHGTREEVLEMVELSEDKIEKAIEHFVESVSI